MKTGKRPDYKGVSTEEYFRPFTTQGQIDEISPVVQAWRLALETRRFEIQLYWTRSAYFWAFVGAAFAGYFALKTQSGAATAPVWIDLIVSFIGLLFAVAWYAVTRASKFWQENWEKHVDFLEDKTIGPMYKTVVNPNRYRLFGLLGARALSVSRINMLLAFVVSIVWASLLGVESFNVLSPRSVYCKIVTVIGVFAVYSLLFVLFFCLARSRISAPGAQENFVRREMTK